MSEPGAAWFESVDELEGLVNCLVHGKRRVGERVEYEFVETFVQSDGRFGDGAEVRQIRGVAEGKTQNLQVTGDQWNGGDGCYKQFNREVVVMGWGEGKR